MLEDIENVLGINTYPMNWPIGCGKEFKGVYDRKLEKSLPLRANNGQKEVEARSIGLSDPCVTGLIGEGFKKQLDEDVELLDIAGDSFDIEAVQGGRLTPVFSAQR